MLVVRLKQGEVETVGITRGEGLTERGETINLRRMSGISELMRMVVWDGEEWSVRRVFCASRAGDDPRLESQVGSQSRLTSWMRCCAPF